MAEASVNGITINYEAAGDGPAVFLSHGYSATGRMWRPQQKALAEAGYRIITWDMRGHGQTDSPDDPGQYSEALTIADMLGLLDLLTVDRAVVGGLSLGGFMSLAFYRAHPQRVRALVLCDTGPGYRNPEARAGWNRAAERRARDLEERGLAALGGGTEVRATGRYHRSAQGLAHAARGMLAQFDARVIDSLPDVKAPTLIIVGEKDEPFRGASDYMAAKIAGARLEVIPDAGHAANLDQPEAFNRVLLSFLGSLPA
ncbi:MAG: alpha/beta hydrolase [Dehalococcoidia bacterium]|nr:alpha/beta hydrolase [Dehalococcoidia bacterium]